MRKLVAVLLLAIFLVSCAPAPAPTAKPPTAAPVSKPTEAPQPSPVPTKAPVGPAAKTTALAPTPQAMAVQNVKQAKQPDGSILTTANITAPENLGIGQMELAAPDAMMLSETRTIRLRRNSSR